MDDRIEQFLTAAQSLQDGNSLEFNAKWKKEISTLRRFLHRNQNARLVEISQQRLVDAIRIHVGCQAKEEECLLLVKDALAMPFGVFGTKHKKKLLKMHEQVLGQHQVVDSDGIEHVAEKSEVWWSCVGMDGDGYLSLLNEETGEMCETIRVKKKVPLWKQIKAHIDQDEIRVNVSDGEVIDIQIS